MKKALLSLALLGLLSPVFADAGGMPPTKFGHRFYPQAREKALAVAGTYRQSGRKVKLRPEAAAAFQKMAAAARLQKVKIIPISGFRSSDYQATLFARAIKRHGSEEKAARWVAPPGYSEHATGWSLDLGQEDAADTDVEVDFENTKAFAWLTAQAAGFGFELSFPKNNAQGVNHEPWHWRYIGAAEAKKLFHPE